MRLPILAAVFSFVALSAACASPPADDAGASTAAAVSSGSEPRTFKASCGGRLGSVDLEVTVTDHAITSIKGTISSLDHKFLEDQLTTSWSATLKGKATKVTSLSAIGESTISIDGELTPVTVDKLKINDEGTAGDRVSGCETTASIASIDIRAKDTPDGNERGISFGGVVPTDATCFEGTGPLDEGGEGWWDVSCGEDDVHSSAEGLDELVAALQGAH